MGFELQRGTTLGKYELLVRIGRGGMASVWVARGRPMPDQPEQLVAIKAMLPDLAQNMEFRSMFLDEGQIVKSIDHPNVVKVYEVGEVSGVLFMAMEWVEGDSLHTLIAEANKRRPIPPELAVRMMADTASGLHAAHELRGWDGELQGVVHCDVSPHNILIGLDGAVKLVDFGVAGAMNRVTQDDEAKIRGKFGYMSPEQAQAKALDRRSDVFSLGIVLFELTTGYRLFRGRDDRHTLDLVIRGRVPKPSQVVDKYPPKLERIVMKALARDLDERYQTADDLRDALDSYLVEERILVPGAGIKGLLKRVLGARLDQRRQQIRAALRAMDGSHPTMQLVSEESILDDSDAISVSVSQVEAISHHSYGSGGMGAARLPSDNSSGAHSMSGPSDDSMNRRSRFTGVALAAGAGFAAATAIFLFMNTRKTEPQVTEIAPPVQHAAAVPSRAIQSATDRTTEDKLGFSIESLPEDVQNERAAGRPSKRSTKGKESASQNKEGTQPTPQQDPQKVTLEDDQVSSVADGVNLSDENKKASAPAPTGAFDKAAAGAALNRAVSMLGLCHRAGVEGGTGKAMVTIGPSGTVQNVDIVGEVAGTPEGACAASQFGRVTVPAFQGDPVTVGKSFTIPK